jgi:hypothetical protein
MFISKMSLPRRTFLRGIGATVALPLLEAMVPALTATAKTAATPRLRFGAVYIPHGAIMDRYTPRAAGTGFEFTPILKPLEAVRDHVVVVSNLDRPGDDDSHATASAAWLSGAVAKKTEGQDFYLGTTIDQVVAKQIGQDTPFPSIEVATEDFTGYVGGCSPAYACAYMNTISWASPTSPVPMEINPRVVFERLFGDGTSTEERLAGRKQNASILDSVTHELSYLKNDLGNGDKQRLDTYLENISELERRIKIAMNNSMKEPNVEVPFGLPESKHVHFRLMYDLMALAFQGDITRSATFMLGRDLTGASFPESGFTGGWHGSSHHGDKPENVANYAKMNRYHVQNLAYFVEKLGAIPDGDGTLLDHILIYKGSNMGNSHRHAHEKVPVVLVGGIDGTFKGNRHIVFPDNTQRTSNMLLSILHLYGIPQEKIGTSTGPLQPLEIA